MKQLIRRFFGKPSSNRTAADARSAELETLEPRMLFSAGPVEAPEDANPEPEGQEQAAEESVTVNPVAAQAAAASVSEVESTQEGLAAEQTGLGQSAVPGNQGVRLLEVDDSSGQLNQETLEAIAEAAADRWRATGLTADQEAALDAIDYQVDSLANFVLGEAGGHSITVDDNAGGRGWFIDSTPLVDEEFLSSTDGVLTAVSGDAADGHDLLTVLLHEQGHILGIEDRAVNLDPADVMSGMIGAGLRRLPGEDQADGALPGSIEDTHFAIATLGTPASAAGDFAESTSFTLAAGTERLLVVFVLEEFDDLINGVTFGATPLIQTDLGAGGVTVDGDYRRLEAWYAVMGDSVTPTTAPVTWTTFDATEDDLASVIAAVAYDGVDQTTPVGGFVSSATSLSTTVTSEVGDLVVGAAFNFGTANDLTEGASQTPIHTHNSIDVGSGAPSATANFMTSSEAGAASVTMSYTAAGTNLPASLAFNINSAAPPALDPEIKIEHTATAVEITDGDTTPTGAGDEGTYFDSVDTATGMVTRTFTITNTGNADLTLTGASPVSVDDNTHFSVTQPALTTLTPTGANQSTTFTVIFNPDADGLQSTTVHVASDDASEADYDFKVEGIGTTLSPTNITQLGSVGSISNNGNPFGETDTLTLPFTVEAGTNRLLVVFGHEKETAADAQITGVTFQSTGGSPTVFPLTGLNLDVEAVDGSGLQQTEIYHLALGSGGQITGEIVMSISDVSGDNDATILTAVAYENVDQTTPVDGFVSTNGTASNSALNVVSEAGDRVVSVHANLSNGGATADPSVDAAQTEIHDLDAVKTFTYLVTSTEPGGALIDTLHSWNSAPPTGQDFVTVAMNINAAPAAPDTTTITIDGSGNLVITDTDGTIDNEFELSSDGTTLTVTDNSGTANTIDLGIVPGGGDGSDEVTVAFGATDGSNTWTGGIIVNGAGGDDDLEINYGASSGTDFNNRTIDYNGQTDGGAPGDSLTLTGGTFTTADFGYDNANDGDIQLNGQGLVSYTGLEPIASTITAADVTLQYSAGVETITVSAAGSQTNVNSSAGESTTFNNPTNSLTINGGAGNDNITLTGLGSGFAADLTVDTEAGGNDSINVNGAINTGGGDASLTSIAGITFSANLTTGGGDILLNADRDNSGDGAVPISGNISSGGGNITVGGGATPATSPVLGFGDVVTVNSGFSMDAGGGNIAIRGESSNFTSVKIFGTVETAGAGTITLEGLGGAGSRSGVRLRAGSTVESVDGAIQITGRGGTGSTFAPGVEHSGQVRATGAGDVTVSGTGTSSTAGVGRGVVVFSNGGFRVTTGALSVTGIASAGNNAGIDGIDGRFLSTGSGTVELTATGSGTASDLAFSNVSAIGDATHLGAGTAATGDITINADSIDLSGTLSVESDGALTIAPRTAGTTIRLGGGTGSTLNLDDTELGFLQDGFSSITIGDATAGDITVTSATFLDPVTLSSAGSIRDTASVPDITAPSVTYDGDGAVSGSAEVGTLNVTGDVTLQTANEFQVEIFGGVPAIPVPPNNDALNATGDVSLGGATLDIGLLLAPTVGAGDVFTIVTSGGTLSGLFKDSGGADIVDGQTLTIGATDLTIDYDYTAGTVTLTESGGVAPTGTTTLSLDGSGNLVIEDGDGGDTDDNLSITRSGGFFTVEDLDGNTVGSSVPGSVQVSPSRVDVPEGAVTGGVIVNTLGGADTVRIGDLGTLAGELTVDGGAGEDEIIQTGDATLTGAGAVDYDAERIAMNSGSSLTTGSGDVNLDGTGRTGSGAGVSLAGAEITSTTGNVGITGEGGDSSHYNRGILLSSSGGVGSTISTGGSVTLNGTGGTTGVHATGVTFLGATVESTGAGPVTITGTGGTGTFFSEGVAIHGFSTIDSGTGDLLIDGTGGSTGAMNRGVFASNSDLDSSGGNIEIDGTGAGTSFFGVGVEMDTVDTTTTGAGTVTIRGTGATGTLGNVGIKLANGSTVNTVNGAIEMRGTGNGSSVINHGIQLATNVAVGATGSGTVTVVGIGGAGTLLNHGVQITTTSTVSAAGGDLTVTGLARGTLSLNKGVEMIGSDLSNTTGNIALTGTGSDSGGGVYNTGVFMSGGGITTASGDITINGLGGEGSTLNEGVRITTAVLESTGGGTLSLTGIAQNPGTTAVYNTGMYLLSMSLNSGGTVSVTGTGGAGTLLNHGVYMQNVTTTGTVPVPAGTVGLGSLSLATTGNFF